MIKCPFKWNQLMLRVTNMWFSHIMSADIKANVNKRMPKLSDYKNNMWVSLAV